jgi:hypothetical protein
MPSEPVRDPRQQMQNRLDRIRRAGGGPEYFLHILQTLSGAISSSTTIESMSYRDNALELKVTAPALADISRVTQQMSKQGMTAEIQSSTPSGSAVEAHVQVRTAGSKPHP